MRRPFPSRPPASCCTTSGRLCAGWTSPTPSGRSRRRRLPMRRLFLLAVIAAVAWWFIERRRGGRGGQRDDRLRGRVFGHARRRLAGARPPAADRLRGPRVAIDDLGGRLVEHALLEGDFVLRSGKRSTWYLDKYRFETRPDLLRELGARLAEVVARGRARRHETRRTGSRSRCAGRFGVHGVRTALHHRAQ